MIEYVSGLISALALVFLWMFFAIRKVGYGSLNCPYCGKWTERIATGIGMLYCETKNYGDKQCRFCSHCNQFYAIVKFGPDQDIARLEKGTIDVSTS